MYSFQCSTQIIDIYECTNVSDMQPDRKHTADVWSVSGDEMSFVSVSIPGVRRNLLWECMKSQWISASALLELH